jgi:pimeloyl-ACP methyl ester carboxylesterase
MPTPLKYTMPIRTKGAYPPLFCIHGEPLKIAMRLQKDRPVYGVSYAYDGFRRSEMPQTIEEYAAICLADIRQIQPHGPYYICGYSVGGMIAYEIANQLVQAGEQVAHLTLVEPTLFRTDAPKKGALQKRMGWFDSKSAMLLHYAKRLPIALWKRGQKSVRVFVTATYLRLDLALPPNLRLSGLLRAIKPIMRRYVYKPLDVRASVIYTHMDEVSVEMAREYWAECLRDDVEVVSIQGVRKHLGLMEEPALGQTIAILDNAVLSGSAAKQAFDPG